MILLYHGRCSLIMGKCSLTHTLHFKRNFGNFLGIYHIKIEDIVISPNTLTNHFKFVLNTWKETVMKPLSGENGPLDHYDQHEGLGFLLIKMNELNKALEVSLPRGKRSWVDYLCNKMISCLINVCLNFLTFFKAEKLIQIG